MNSLTSEALRGLGLTIASFAGVLAFADANMLGPMLMLVFATGCFSASAVQAMKQR